MITFIPTYLILIGYIAYGFQGNDENYCSSAVRGNYSIEMNITVDANNESIIHFPVSKSKYPYRVLAFSKMAQPDFPIFIVVKQQREVTSWEIPLLVESHTETLSFFNTSRTLCHNDMEFIAQQGYGDIDYHKQLSVSISTFSIIPVTVTLFVKDQVDFYIELDKNYTALVSPSAPKYFYYRYSKNDEDFEDTVILEVNSLDVTCLIVSIQNYECPVFDLNEDIKYDGQYETINTRGGIIINKKHFPKGFFVIFVAKPDNFDCDGDNLLSINKKEIKPLNHSSIITFTIKENISPQDYASAIILTLITMVVFCLIVTILSCVFHLLENKYWRTSQNLIVTNTRTAVSPTTVKNDSNVISNEGMQDDGDNEGHKEIPSTSSNVKNLASDNPEPSQSMVNEDSNFETIAIINDTDALLPIAGIANDHSTDGNTNTDTAVKDPYERIDALLRKPLLKLSDLATKNPNSLSSDTNNFFCHVITVGIFYGTPVVQLVITHQRIMNITGNLDMCYYNFLCAHPLISLNDFNHIYSNLGYIVAGALFIFITACRDHALGRCCKVLGRCHVLCRANVLNLTHVDNFGIPKHYGLYYAMGTAVIMEGILSACYHICPSQENFQFDTSFMYVIAVLGLVKLYQNRHPDINATAHIIFLLLSVATLITAVGIFENHIAVWGVFIFAYVCGCIFVTLKIYFVNNICRGYQLFWNDLDTTDLNSFFQSIKPVKMVRFIFLGIALSVNLTVAFFGFYFQIHDTLDFGSFLLMILLMNTFGYTLAYIILKCVYCEPCTLQYLTYIILCGICWGFATKFYFKHSTEWRLTAAESRQKNTHCILQNFYDYHDIWHLLSATALFFSCMLLLTIDDRLIYIPHSDIVIF